MPEEPFKVRVSKGKVKIVAGEKPQNLDELESKAKQIKKLFKNILIEIYNDLHEPRKDELVNSVLDFLGNQGFEGKLNDAYIILEGERKNPDLYLAILGKKLTLVTWSKYFKSNSERLSKLLQTIINRIDFGESFNLKLSNEVDVETLQRTLDNIDKRTLFEIDLRHPSLELFKKILESFPEVKYIEVRKTKDESIRFQREIGLLEIEIENEEKILNKLGEVRDIINRLDFLETETVDCLDEISKMLQDKSNIEGLSITKDENKLVIEILKKGLKERIQAKHCNELAR